MSYLSAITKAKEAANELKYIQQNNSLKPLTPNSIIKINKIRAKIQIQQLKTLSRKEWSLRKSPSAGRRWWQKGTAHSPWRECQSFGTWVAACLISEGRDTQNKAFEDHHSRKLIPQIFEMLVIDNIFQTGCGCCEIYWFQLPLIFSSRMKFKYKEKKRWYIVYFSELLMFLPPSWFFFLMTIGFLHILS